MMHFRRGLTPPDVDFEEVTADPDALENPGRLSHITEEDEDYEDSEMGECEDIDYED